MSDPLDYESAPLISPDPNTKFPAIQTFWHDVHVLLNDEHPPAETMNELLRRVGLSFGADRAYAFAVSGDQTTSSCTSEWTREPWMALKDKLQNVSQRGLKGWLARFEDNDMIAIEDTANPPDDLRMPAAKFRRDDIQSIYVFGFYDEGKLIGYLGIDYVTRKYTLDALSKDILFQVASTLNLFLLRYEALELWNRTAEQMPLAMFIKDIDNDDRYIYSNPRYRDFIDDSLGKNDIEAFGEEIGVIFRRQDLDVLASGNPYVENGPMPDRKGSRSGYYTLTKFPVTTQMSRRYIAGFITDISAEHKLRIEAQELLEKSKEAEKAKSLFLAAMSHEIRTPLNAIIGLIDELRHTDIPEDARSEYLSSASAASRALLALINDVLDVSKIEAGQMHMTPVETDLLLLLGECSSIFSESCRGKNIDYKCDVSPNMPIIIIDTSRLRQIMFNLIGNAVKFTSVGGVYVYAKFVRGENKSGTMTIQVSDTGPGITEEDQKHIFGLFEQAERMRGSDAANKGSGLGLCLCKRLVECMHGEIAVQSELHKGSTFTITLNNLPYVEQSEASDVIRHRKDQTVRINPISLAAKVLIVDDVPMNLKVLGLILRRMNIKSVPANSAKEALEILKGGGITHVLTDIWMPEMNGEGLARAIRDNPQWNDIRLAAQTADVEASNNFDASLFDAILSKPITPEKVLAFISRGRRS